MGNVRQAGPEAAAASSIQNIGGSSMSRGRFLPLAVLLVTLGWGALPPTATASMCDADKLCPTDPCTISGRHFLDSGCSLDFGTKDVTVGPDAALVWLPPRAGEGPTGGSIGARSFTLRGRITAANADFFVFVDQDLIVERQATPPGPPRGGEIDIRGSARFTDCSLEIDANGSVVLGGSSLSLHCGQEAMLVVNATSIDVNGPISTRAGTDFAEGQATINLTSSPGSIRVTDRLSTNGVGNDSSSAIFMTADQDVSVAAPMFAKNVGAFGSGAPSIIVTAGGDVTLGRIDLSTFFAGGIVQVEAPGNIVFQGDINAPVLSRPGSVSGGQVVVIGDGAGTVDLRNTTVDLSCQGPLRNCVAAFGPGSIAISEVCSTDVSGAVLRARGNAPISLGCTCIHRPGNLCDGGCIGLDQATIVPPLPSPLPLCPQQ
jgi:hypothetical protein